MKCIHVTPAFPPDVNGIGYYALRLGESLFKNYSVMNYYISLSKPGNVSDAACSNVYFLSNQKNELDVLIKHLLINCKEEFWVIVHYDRGLYDSYINKDFYNKFQIQKNLTNALVRISKLLEGKIIVVYHEYLSPGFEQRRDFFLRPIQKWYMKRILKSSRHSICSNPVVKKMITSIYNKASVIVHPVFSNIGEPVNIDLSVKKNDQWVVFGSTNNIIQALNKLLSDIKNLNKSYEINSLFIVGGMPSSIIKNLISGLKKFIKSISYIPDISSEEASGIFRTSRFCYMCYFPTLIPDYPQLLFKSSVFATACAFGTIPVLGHEGMNSLKENCHHPGVISIENGDYTGLPLIMLNEHSESLFDWYNKNSSLRTLTETVYKLTHTKRNEDI